MKLVNKFIDKHGAGHVTLRPEDDEDIWHLYNLIQDGDSVRAPAVRRVQTISSTGSTESHRVRLNLTVQVSRVEFSSSTTPSATISAGDQEGTSSSAPAATATLHISGRVTSENPHVKLGAFHTLDVEVSRDVRIEKLDGWDSVAIARVEEAIIPGRGAEVGAVVCGEGVAAFCLLSQHMTIVTHRISVAIPRKSASSGASQHDKALVKFYGTLYDSFVRHIPYATVGLRAIVIASPGWVRDAVFDYIMEEAAKRGDKILQKALKEKTVRVHVNSPHVHSLVEVLKSPEVSSQLKETKFAKEGITLDKFFKMLGSDEMRAWYGPDHVHLAADRGAIGTLLISDDLFRASEPIMRKKYVALVEAVQQKGGEVVIFSSMHESGQQLNQLTGIAAILTFPLDIEVVEAEEAELAHDVSTMLKRNHLMDADTGSHVQKRAHITKAFHPIKVASQEAAAVADASTPFYELEMALDRRLQSPQKGDCIVYWMRMSDLRTVDNKALDRASKHAQQDGIPLIVLFVISPQDYMAHDRSARRVDFTLRNLAVLRKFLAKSDIPLYTSIEASRKMVPSSVLSFCEKHGATGLFGNIEYEIDELRRDIEICKLAFSKGVQANLFHNKCLVEPGVILTKQKKPYAVYSPYQRQWIATINANISHYLEDSPPPMPNNESIRSSDLFGPLFDVPVPNAIKGFELDGADRAVMEKAWPEGEDVAAEILQRFLTTKSRSSQLAAVDPLSSGSEGGKDSRITKYAQDRDFVDRDTTSRLSAYLSSGVISVRACLREVMLKSNMVKIEGSGASGVGRWIQEIAWRDFYTGILASFPRVSMGRPYLEKFSAVVWENPEAPEGPAVGRVSNGNRDSESLQRWKAGQTGVPIVDATMRCINEMGWVHNRARMITAMYLTKDLMIDWKVGERYFMEKLIDGDLASNNGGWQWCASSGVDPCPYFRIFNPYTQSLKADPSGDFIRHWVPELGHLRGPDVHSPSAAVANKLGYFLPIIPHKEARERAIRRFKNPGVE